MDHNDAVRLQAAEKYLLGELPNAQRDEYEEHYFECAACAEELKATVAFLESARQVVHEKAPEVVDVKRLAPAVGGWFGWLRPAVAIPVFAALLLFIGYQNGVTIPKLKGASSLSSAQLIGSSFQLMGSVRGGGDTADSTNKVRVNPGESFTLNFDFTPYATFSDYGWQLLDPNGKKVLEGHLSGDKKYQAVSLPIIGGVESAGKYTLVFSGVPAVPSQGTKAEEAQQLTFTVEFPH